MAGEEVVAGLGGKSSPPGLPEPVPWAAGVVVVGELAWLASRDASPPNSQTPLPH